jgi:putative redox protein
MTATTTYLGDLRTEATHLRSGNTIFTDAPVDNQGKGEAFSPTDLVATGLGVCILTMMGITARNYQLDMVGATASVNKIMAANPRRIARIEVHVKMPAKPFTDREKLVLEKAAHHCPVKESLHPDLEEVITIEWPEL